ncbi:pyridoxal-phosphate-dependent aminotransferase family protein [Marinivivus vitaminiproducens]|uniref:pyridoxal-phosphate-dependent aminotransferase family protein n=1 Tax=Marinivivus vitaminiproducens TaxID=3035935 RepID=UPI0027A8D265|nr:aminotransferase class V-fold PLP-dependent enzyme [Geminicoccaceae bacterium SCSIO 64248]
MLRRGRDFIQLPGPTNVPERIVRAMNRMGSDFAEPTFTRMVRACMEDLRDIFQTKGEVYPYVAIGHGGWEAVLTNLFAPGDRILIPETGRFSESWRDMAQALGFATETVPGDWRTPVDADALETVLRADRDRTIKGVLAVQIETSTGIAHDIHAIRRAIDRADHPALLAVDAVASLAIMDLPMDAWRVDLVLAASQKGLMMPPGLSFVAAGPRALAAAEEGGAPRKYWDWRARRGEESYMWFYGTPPVQLLHGLREAIDMIQEEGLPQVFARHHRLAGTARAAVSHWAQAGGMAFQAVVPESRSASVTAIRFAEGYDPEAVRRLARDRFSVAFGGGLGELYGHVMRIGHLGDLNEPMILGALGVLEACLKLEGVPHMPGGVTAAIDHLAADR